MMLVLAIGFMILLTAVTATIPKSRRELCILLLMLLGCGLFLSDGPLLVELAPAFTLLAMLLGVVLGLGDLRDWVNEL